MVWLHPKKIKKKKNEETLGSNFRGYTHTHTHTVWLYTQKKEEEGFCDSRGVHKSKKFSRRNIHTTHQVYIEKKNYLWFSFGHQTWFVFSQWIRLAFFCNQFLFFFTFFIVFEDFDLVGIAQIIAVAASVHVRHFFAGWTHTAHGTHTHTQHTRGDELLEFFAVSQLCCVIINPGLKLKIRW